MRKSIIGNWKVAAIATVLAAGMALGQATQRTSTTPPVTRGQDTANAEKRAKVERREEAVKTLQKLDSAANAAALKRIKEKRKKREEERKRGSESGRPKEG